MSEWRALPATKSVLAEQALKLCEDMKVARKEEKLLTEKGSPQTVTFELPDDGNQKITALRAVVAARAFKGGMLEGKDPNTVSVPKEAGEGASVDVNVVFVKGVSMATMEQAVEHMYASDIELTDASVYDLLVAANLMGLEGLKALCACMLSAPSKLKPATVCKILVAAHSAEAPALKEACLAFLDSDIKDVAGRGGYGLEELPADIMAEVCGRDSLSMGELELFKIVMRWGENERARLTKLQTGAAPPPPAEGGGGAVADVAAAPGGVAAAAPAGGAPPPGPSLSLALSGVIEKVRFPLISPEKLRDVVQPMMQKGGGGGGGMHEALVLEGYQHHALMRIGQPSNVAPDKCRPRCGANPEPLGAREDQQLLQARASAVRTYRWLQGLPSNVERLSMSGMQLEVDDAILVEDFLRRRGRNLVELDLKSNRLDCKALLHILAGLRHTPKLAGLALGENPLWQGAASSQLGKLLGDTLEQHCPKLERLGLGGTGLQDDDVKFLAAAIKSHSSLKQLGLSGCKVTRTGVESLALAAGSARTALHTLVLTRNPAVSDPEAAGQLDALRALFPPHVALRI